MLGSLESALFHCNNFIFNVKRLKSLPRVSTVMSDLSPSDTKKVADSLI